MKIQLLQLLFILSAQLSFGSEEQEKQDIEIRAALSQFRLLTLDLSISSPSIQRSQLEQLFGCELHRLRQVNFFSDYHFWK